MQLKWYNWYFWTSMSYITINDTIKWRVFWVDHIDLKEHFNITTEYEILTSLNHINRVFFIRENFWNHWIYVEYIISVGKSE